MVKKGLFYCFLILNSVVFAQEKIYKLYSPDERFIATLEYDEIGEFSMGLAFVRMRDKYGYINTEGREVVPLKFAEAQGFSKNGLAVVKEGWKYGFIDKSGSFVIPASFENAFPFDDNGLAIVRKQDFHGVINAQGKEVFPFDFEEIHLYKEMGYCIKGGKGGLFSLSGTPLSDFIYDNAGECSEGKMSVNMNGLWGIVDTKGREIVACKYEDMGRFSEGMAGVILNGKGGYLNLNGVAVTECIYDALDEFTEGLAATNKGGKWGYLDKTGKEVIPFMYESAYKFAKNGVATVVKEGEYLNITRQNQVTKTEPEAPVFDTKPEFHAVEVEDGQEVVLTYADLTLKVKKTWKGFGNADKGVIQDLKTQEILADNVTFYKNKIYAATLYSKGNSYLISKADFPLSELRNRILAESTKPITKEEKVEQNKNLIAKYEELQKLIDEVEFQELQTLYSVFDLMDSKEVTKQKRKKQVEPYQNAVKKTQEVWNYIKENNGAGDNSLEIEDFVKKHTEKSRKMDEEIAKM